MVYELTNISEVREHIRKNQLAGIAIANKGKERVWNYVIELLKRLENISQPRINFAIVHYEMLLGILKPFEIGLVQRSVLIKLYLNGECIFEQEGVLGTKLNDEITLKRGIRESLKLYSVDIKFTNVMDVDNLQ